MKLSGVKVGDIVRVGDEHPPTHGFVVELARGRLRTAPYAAPRRTHRGGSKPST